MACGISANVLGVCEVPSEAREFGRSDSEVGYAPVIRRGLTTHF